MFRIFAQLLIGECEILRFCLKFKANIETMKLLSYN